MRNVRERIPSHDIGEIVANVMCFPDARHGDEGSQWLFRAPFSTRWASQRGIISPIPGKGLPSEKVFGLGLGVQVLEALGIVCDRFLNAHKLAPLILMVWAGCEGSRQPTCTLYQPRFT